MSPGCRLRGRDYLELQQLGTTANPCVPTTWMSAVCRCASLVSLHCLADARRAADEAKAANARAQEAKRRAAQEQQQRDEHLMQETIRWATSAAGIARETKAVQHVAMPYKQGYRQPATPGR